MPRTVTDSPRHGRSVRRRARRSTAFLPLFTALALAACGGPEAASPSDADADSSSAAAESPGATTGTTVEERTDAETAFLAWLEASRSPDVAEACAAMTDALVDRMLAEMEADGFPGVDSCEAMIEVSAELYKSFGSSAEVTVEVQEETDIEAVLFVTYLDSGDCGTVTMAWQTGRWMLTEQSEECAGR